jgi:tetratricopeptide (TPR) repeat protein
MGTVGWWARLGLCLALATIVTAEEPAESLSDRVERLIAELGANEYSQRERAQAQLLKAGPDAYDALQAAVNHEDIEIAARARYLVRLIRIDWTREDDPPAVKELLKSYDQLTPSVRLQRIEELSKLPGDAGVSALCRVVRFEKSPVLAKQAALRLLGRPLPPDVTPQARRQQLLDSLGSSSTTPTGWLRLEAETQADPAGAAEAWSKVVADEQTALARAPQTTQNEIVARLLRRQVDLLKQLGRPEEAEAAMIRSLDYEPGTPETLPKLLDWLVEQKAWKALDAVATRFAPQFEQQPILLYLLANARLKQGQSEQAEQAAKKALEVNGANQVEHYKLGRDLQQRGMVDWSAREFQAAIDNGPLASLPTFASQSALAELLHDHGRHLEAAKALEPAVEELDRNAEHRRQVQERLGREAGGVKSRMHYFFAMDHREKGDLAKTIEHLDQAIAADPTDADALIGLHRLPNQDEARRQRTSELIKAAADVFRKQISQSPEDSTPYNQFAWLVGNTEGDYAEALRYSQKSLELAPNAAGYLDTLGRCYYALGDLDNAIKYQTQAVTLEPHSGAMQRQLVLFKEELAKKERK